METVDSITYASMYLTDIIPGIVIAETVTLAVILVYMFVLRFTVTSVPLHFLFSLAVAPFL